MNGGLLRIGLLLQHALERALVSGAGPLEQLPRLEKPYNAALATCRQVDRFMRLDMDLEARRKGGAAGKTTVDGPPPSES